MYIPVVIHKDADTDYGVTVPDIPWMLLSRCNCR